MMTPFFVLLIILAVFLWRRTRNVPEFAVRFVAASVFLLIPYLVVAFGVILVSGTFQTREDGEAWREQQIAETGVDPCEEPEDEGPDVLPGISQKSLDEANSLTWEEKEQKQKEAQELWYKCQTGR